MKYIKIIFLLLVLAYVVSIPLAIQARPSGFLYGLETKINEPVWVWVNITGPARAETLARQLDQRYAEIESAWFSKNSAEEKSARVALDITVGRVIATIISDTRSGDYKSADTLAANSVSITSIHKQVLKALIDNDTTRSGLDIMFMQNNLSAFEQFRSDIDKQFRDAYQQQNLVKGIDGKISLLDQTNKITRQALTDAQNMLRPEQYATLTDALAATTELYTTAQNYVGKDFYVDGYITASTAIARYKEINTAITASENFSVSVLPAQHKDDSNNK